MKKSHIIILLVFFILIVALIIVVSGKDSFDGEIKDIFKTEENKFDEDEHIEIDRLNPIPNADDIHKEIPNLEFNQYRHFNASQEHIANLYFSNLKRKYTLNPDSFKEITKDLEEFSLDFSNKIEKVQYSDDMIQITDNFGFIYTFYINHVLNYDLEIEKDLQE